MKHNKTSIFIFFVFVFSSVLIKVPAGWALDQEEIKKRVAQYGITQVTGGVSTKDILLFNDTKQRNEDFENYLKDQKLSILYLWTEACIQCLNTVKYIDVLKSHQEMRGITPLNIIVVANLYDNQRNIRRKTNRQDLKKLDLLFIKNRDIFTSLIGDQESVVYIIDQDGNIFARIDKANFRDGSFTQFLRSLQEHVSK